MFSRRDTVFRAAALARLSSPEQLDERMRVVSARAWLALASLGALIVAFILWSCLGQIALKVKGTGQLVSQKGGPATEAGATHAVIFVPASDVRRVRPGQAVQLVPATHAAQDGFVHGTVDKVLARPATRAELSEFLGDEVRARQLAGVGIFRVDVALATGGELPTQLPCNANVVVAQERPIALVLPALSRLFGP